MQGREIMGGVYKMSRRAIKGYALEKKLQKRLHAVITSVIKAKVFIFCLILLY